MPGFNDSDDELRGIANFLARLSPDMPWHVTAFHKDYKLTEPDNTPAAALIHAAEMGRQTGLRYVYAGNLPGRVGNLENTYCASCGERLVRRRGFMVLENGISEDGRCPACSAGDPGSLVATHEQHGRAPP